MDHIPLASIFSLITFGMALFCVVFIAIKRRSLMSEGFFTDNFFKAFLLVSAYLLTTSSPGIFTSNPLTIQVLYLVGNFFLEITSVYLAYTAFLIFFPRHSSLIAFIIPLPFIFHAVYLLAFSARFIVPATMVFVGPFVDWHGAELDSVVYLAASLFVLVYVLTFIFLFYLKGWNNPNQFVRRRSRLFVIGIGTMISGWLSIQIFSSAPVSPASFLISSALGAFLAGFGMLVLLRGVLIRENGNS
ncbi:MAG: hypothetical protein WC628_10340 [Candidatus Omnitrophota bacterium]